MKQECLILRCDSDQHAKYRCLVDIYYYVLMYESKGSGAGRAGRRWYFATNDFIF